MQAGRLRVISSGAAGLLLVVGLGLAGCGAPRASSPPASSAPAADSAAAQQALDALVSAVHEGRTGAPGLTGVVEANARALKVAGFAARVVGPVAGATPASAGSWVGDVAVTWRFAGFDARDVTEKVAVTFAPSNNGTLAVSGVGGQEGYRAPLWLTGPVQVRRAPGVLVVVAGPAATADTYLDMARKAVVEVRRVVPWPHPDLVVEVPADEAAFEAELGAAPGSDAGVAAVTTTVNGSAVVGTPVHVFVNPQGIGDLTDPGAQVVLTHEATHDATGVVPRSGLPTWLREGFADYVALLPVHLPFAVTAEELRADVRAHGAPRTLPTNADFNAAAENFGEKYEQAWTACRTIADIGGQAALVRVYDAVKNGAPLNATLRAQIGIGVAGLTARWRHQLVVWSR